MKIQPILIAASEAFEVKPADVLSLSRRDHIVKARHAVMMLAHERGATWSQITDYFRLSYDAGPHGNNRAIERMAKDPDYRAAIAEIQAVLKGAEISV